MTSTHSSRADLPYWLALLRFAPFGPVRMQKLARRFPDMKQVFEAGLTSLLEAGIEPAIVHQFLQQRLHLDPEAEMARLTKTDARAITIKDPEYPPLLKTLFDPPSVLFVRGTLPSPSKKHLAVVGSRKQTSYGTDVTRFLIEPLARAGVVIVSGLAYGIDACAHQTCLDHQGITVAVLGSGVDQESLYPSGNRALASQILARGGALISEFPIGTSPLKHHFPIRNRIIAGLCDGTLVIEATMKSGSLITARAALEAGRDVYAVPGPIQSPLSEGPHSLIKMGAIPVTGPEDLFGLSALTASTTTHPSYVSTNDEETVLLRVMDKIPRHIDELCSLSGLQLGRVSTLLTMLEIKSAIRHDGGQHYSLL